MRSQTGSVAGGVSVRPWHTSPSGQHRLEEEIAQLRAHYSQPEVAVKDGADGNTTFVIKTPSLPGQTYYIKTTPRFPNEPPVMMLEKDGEGLAVGSRVLTNWQPTTWLVEVIEELVGSRVRGRVLILGGVAFGTIVLIAAVGLILFLTGQSRINRVDAIATAGALSTEVAQNYDDLQTLQATATAAALLNPAMVNQPDPTLAAAADRLKQLRDRNNQALATVTALAQRDATITAQAVQQSNQQTQDAYRTQLTSDAQGQQTATAIANQITNQPAPTVWVQPAPTPIGRRVAPPQPTPTPRSVGQSPQPPVAPATTVAAPQSDPTTSGALPSATSGSQPQPTSAPTVAPPTPTVAQPGVTVAPQPTATAASQPQPPATVTPPHAPATATPHPSSPTPVSQGQPTPIPATPTTVSAPLPTVGPTQAATSTPGSSPAATPSPGSSPVATFTPAPTQAATATPVPTPIITLPPLPTLAITLPPILPHSVTPAQSGEFYLNRWKELSL